LTRPSFAVYIFSCPQPSGREALNSSSKSRLAEQDTPRQSPPERIKSAQT
jgi:hypothetical protein